MRLNIFKLNTRYNPTCGQPIIRIKNTGETTLTALTITYGIEGGDDYTYAWTGSLEFLEEATVQLPPIEVADYYGGVTSFIATISDPNGMADEYEHNNSLTSEFEVAPIHAQQMIVDFRTNSRPFENSYQIFDTEGNVVFERDFDDANTTHSDLINLPPGCYEFVAYDTGGDGMNNWPSGHGNGSIVLKNVDGTVITSLERWFGEYIRYNFRNDADLSNEDNEIDSAFTMYPNPTEGTVTIALLNSLSSFSIEVYSLTGSLLFEDKDITSTTYTVNLQNLNSGMYMVHLKSDAISQVQKLLVK